jgi:hypothetical protein
MEGHDELKQRVSDPTKVFLREIALTMREDIEEFNTTDLVDRANRDGIDLPGWDGTRQDDGAESKHMGIVLGKCFGKTDSIELDGFTITRSEKRVPRDDGNGNWNMKIYTFKKAGAPPPVVPVARPASGFCNIPPKPPISGLTTVTTVTTATHPDIYVIEEIPIDNENN